MGIIYPEVSFTPEWKEGRKFERQRIIKIVDNFCFGDTEENIEIKRALKKEFVLCVEKEL